MSLGQAASVVPVVFWAGGLARAPAAIHMRERRPLCAALLAFAVALTVDVPAVYTRVDGWLGIPNVADLVEHVFGMVGVFAVLVTLNHLGTQSSEQSDAHARRSGTAWRWIRLAVLTSAMGASVGLFFAARLPREAAHFTAEYGQLPVIAAYWSITLAYFGVALVELAQMVATRSAHVDRPTLRIGLRIVGIGVILGVIYSAIKIVELVVDEDSHAGAVRRVADRLDPIVLVTGAIVIGLGLLLPAADTTWHHVGAGARDRATLLRLRPLWRDLTEAMPEVVLGERPSLWADLCGRDPSFRLYRRIIEVRDVALAARVGETVPTLTPNQVAALLTGLADTDHVNAQRSAGAIDDEAAEDAGAELRPLLGVGALLAARASASVGCDSVIGVTQRVQVPTMDSRWWARAVSESLGPVPLGVAVCLAVGAASEGWAGAGWGLLAAGFAAVLPYAVTWRLRHPRQQGPVSRRARVAYLLVTLVCAVAGVLLVGLLGGPERVVAVAITLVAGLAVAATLNARWRLSNHACAAAGGSVILAVLYGPIYLAGFLVAAGVSWSRVRLGRHTVVEVAAGALVGAVVCAAVLPLLT